MLTPTRIHSTLNWCMLPGIAAVIALSGCTPHDRDDQAVSYSGDLRFLRQHTEVIELRQGRGRIAVTPELQGRVMTSGFSPGGLSLGWLHRENIAAGERDISFNNFGGADRFWLGPEGGQFSIYFKQGDEQVLDNWYVPDAIDRGAYEVVAADRSTVHMRADMETTNASGTHFKLRTERTVRTLPRDEAEEHLRTGLPDDVDYLGFVTENHITNTGDAAWTEEGGTLSIWILGMFPSRDRTIVIAPFEKRGEGPEVRTHYFAEPPPERLVIDGDRGVVLFSGDGKFRSKLGLPPSRAKDRLGSIDFDKNILTITHFDMTPGQRKYVSSFWELPQAEPFGGDVTNAYNDNPAPDGGNSFFELETSSPAAFLEPGQSIAHYHRTLQFHGPLERLSEISEKVLGVELEYVRRRMP